MEPGDLIRLQGTHWSSYTRQDQIGIIIQILPEPGGWALVLWEDGEVAKFSRPNHLKVLR